MSKSKIYGFLAIGLLLINAVLIFFILKREKDHEGPKRIIIEKLHFDKNQVKDYEILIADHKQKVVITEIELLESKNKLYALVGSSNSILKDSLIQSIAHSQSVLEKIHFDHISKIKSICRKEQLPYFQELQSEIYNLFFKRKMITS